MCRIWKQLPEAAYYGSESRKLVRFDQAKVLPTKSQPFSGKCVRVNEVEEKWPNLAKVTSSSPLNRVSIRGGGVIFWRGGSLKNRKRGGVNSRILKAEQVPFQVNWAS